MNNTKMLIQEHNKRTLNSIEKTESTNRKQKSHSAIAETKTNALLKTNASPTT